jgi:CDP-diacylglycerol--serine O-phosphatidyltransferase
VPTLSAQAKARQEHFEMDQSADQGPIHRREARRRFRRSLFRRRRIPVRMLVPNFFTLLSLCAGLTAMRMAIEKNFDAALLLIAAAALIDGIDGRLARALNSQSRFGAELDSLADTVNFGVAPAMILYIWALGGMRGFGWVAVMVFACCMGLRLARFNAALDTEKPKWMSNYFTGIPAPAGAVTVLLPFYIDGLGLVDVRSQGWLIAIYVLAIAFMLVSTIPTWSGKLMGERISRELVLPIFAGVVLVLGLLWTFPHATMSVLTLAYLAAIPFSYRRFKQRVAADAAIYSDPLAPAAAPISTPPPRPSAEQRPATSFEAPPTETKH